MFTGLIEAVGQIVRQENGVLTVAAPHGFAQEGLEIGESVAVNGVCLTVVSDADALRFDLSEETLKRSNLGLLGSGDAVNLERALSFGEKLGGHLVQGHVDATALVVGIEESGNSTVVRYRVEDADSRYLIDKGSVCLDGISLTVVDPVGPEFSVWVIPHTLANTNLGSRKVGDRVNVEFDVIAKYVEKLVGPYQLRTTNFE